MTLSYHNDPAVKAFHVNQAQHHFDADMLASGTYGYQKAGKGFRGCSIGCMAHDIDPGRTDYHEVVAEHAGWPSWLVYLNDSIFEGLPEGERERFHVDLREAIPVGVDLEPVRHKLKTRRIDRLIKAQTKELESNYPDQVPTAIRKIIEEMRAFREPGNTFGLAMETMAATATAREVARSAAVESAVAMERAVESAVAAAESATAESEARSAEWAARSAQWAARAARAGATEAWKQEASDLLELLKEAK